MSKHFELKLFQVFLRDGESSYYVIAYDKGHAVVEVCKFLNESLQKGEIPTAPDDYKKTSVKELSVEDAYDHVLDYVYFDPNLLGALDPQQQISFGELFQYLESDELNATYPIYGVAGDNFIGY